MKCMAILAVLAALIAAPGAVFAQTENHVEVGGFAQYYRFDQGGSSQNSQAQSLHPHCRGRRQKSINRRRYRNPHQIRLMLV